MSNPSGSQDLFFNVPVKTTLARNKGNRLIMRIKIPVNSRVPIIPSFYPGHSDIRAFDNFLKEGGRLGKILLVGVVKQNSRHWRSLSSFAYTADKPREGANWFEGKRLILFLPWDPNFDIAWKVDSQGGVVTFNPHHISFDTKGKGPLHYHPTGVNSEKRNELQGSCPAVDDGFVLGHLILPRITVLRRFKSLIGVSGWRCNSIDQFNKRTKELGQSLAGEYPVLVLPRHINDDAKPGILCSYFLSRSDWHDRSFSTRFRSTQFKPSDDEPNKEKVLQHMFTINIADDVFLSMCLAQIGRQPQGKIEWIPPRDIQVNGNEIECRSDDFVFQ